MEEKLPSRGLLRVLDGEVNQQGNLSVTDVRYLFARETKHNVQGAHRKAHNHFLMKTTIHLFQSHRNKWLCSAAIYCVFVDIHSEINKWISRLAVHVQYRFYSAKLCVYDVCMCVGIWFSWDTFSIRICWSTLWVNSYSTVGFASTDESFEAQSKVVTSNVATHPIQNHWQIIRCVSIFPTQTINSAKFGSFMARNRLLYKSSISCLIENVILFVSIEICFTEHVSISWCWLSSSYIFNYSRDGTFKKLWISRITYLIARLYIQ